MSLSSRFSHTARAALAAAGLAAALAAVPTAAFAQPEVDFRTGGITLGFGSGGFNFGISCLSRNDIRRGLRRADFEEIEFVRFNSRRAVVEALWDEDGEYYSIEVMRCTGETDIERLD